MTTELTVYLDRDNEEQLQLLQDKVPVTAAAVTRAVFTFGDYVVDSDIDTGIIYFKDSDNQTVCLKLGLLTGLVIGKYRQGTLTIFDATNVNGIAWSYIDVIVKEWDIS